VCPKENPPSNLVPVNERAHDACCFSQPYLNRNRKNLST
jgi:hypothetical protein